MPKDTIRTFFELRAGFQGMLDFSTAALEFMDNMGFAVTARKYTRRNGEAAEPSTTVERKKRAVGKLLAARGANGNGNHAEAPEEDGKHWTIKEAAKALKVSEAHVRTLTTDGRLPPATYETRKFKGSGKDGSKFTRPMKVMVLLKDDVLKYKESLKEAAASA